MTDEERHGTRRDDDVLFAGPYRDSFWRSIQENRNETEIVKADMKNLENAVMRFERLSDGLAGDMKQIRIICETLNETLIRLDARISATEKQIGNLWAFPLKIMGAIIAVAGASSAVVAMVKWFVPRIQIGGPQ